MRRSMLDDKTPALVHEFQLTCYAYKEGWVVELQRDDMELASQWVKSAAEVGGFMTRMLEGLND